MTHRTLSALALTLLATGLAPGCASSTLAGNWNLVRATPNREMFSIDDVTFTRDGRFTGATTIDGRTTAEEGTYFFNGFKIVFRPIGGGQREFNATLQVNTLRIIDAQKRQVVLKRS